MSPRFTSAKSLLIASTLLAFTFGSTSCITKRTTSDGSTVISEKYVVKRPVKNLLNNIDGE